MSNGLCTSCQALMRRIDALMAENDRLRDENAAHFDLIETAWTIIANAGGWEPDLAATPGWRAAAERWRDEYHSLLDHRREADRG